MVGSTEGNPDVGIKEGLTVGAVVGCSEGAFDGDRLGLTEGLTLGVCDGFTDGSADGDKVGSTLGE